MVSAALIFITIYTITVVPRVGVSASGDVGVGGGVEKVGRLRAQFKATGNGDSQTKPYRAVDASRTDFCCLLHHYS